MTVNSEWICDQLQDNNTKGVSNGAILTPRFGQLDLVVQISRLQPRVAYTFELRASTSIQNTQSVPASSSVIVVVNSPPWGGRALATHSTDGGVFQRLSLSGIGWNDSPEDLPLQYRVGYMAPLEIAASILAEVRAAGVNGDATTSGALSASPVYVLLRDTMAICSAPYNKTSNKSSMASFTASCGQLIPGGYVDKCYGRSSIWLYECEIEDIAGVCVCVCRGLLWAVELWAHNMVQPHL